MQVKKTKQGAITMPKQKDPIEDRFFEFYDEVLQQDSSAHLRNTKQGKIIVGNITEALRQKIYGTNQQR